MQTQICGVVGPFGRLTARSSCERRALRAHVHEELSVIFHCGGATLAMQVGNESVQLHSGQALVIKPWQLHAPVGSGKGYRSILNLLIKSSWFDEAVRPLGAASVGVYVGTGAIDMRPSTQHLASDIVERALGSCANCSSILVRDVVSVLADLFYAGGSAEACAYWPSVERRSGDARTRRALEYILAHPTEAFCAKRTATAAGMSRAQLFRSFKAALGCPPRYVADAMRVGYSVRALGQPDLQIADIADELGFSAPGHFVKFFTEHLGVPPGRFRRNLQNSLIPLGVGKSPLKEGG